MSARVLIVGGSPEAAPVKTVRDAAADCCAVVAVDRGFDTVLSAGLSCSLFCGDCDTVQYAGDIGALCEIERYNSHKDQTDLGLALQAIKARWGDARLCCTCLSGGRPDHLLGVLGRLSAWPGEIELVEDIFRGRILHAGECWHLKGQKGHLFSLVSLSASGAVVSETGMRWELDCEPIDLLSDRGISNVVDSNDAFVACQQGVVGCWLFDMNC